jgi:hypothetical protein
LQSSALRLRRLDDLRELLARLLELARLEEGHAEAVSTDAKLRLRGDRSAERVDGERVVTPFEVRPTQVAPGVLGRGVENVLRKWLERVDRFWKTSATPSTLRASRMSGRSWSARRA